METEFIENTEVEHIKTINTLIRFTKGDFVTIDKHYYEVVQVSIDMDKNFIQVWVESAE